MTVRRWSRSLRLAAVTLLTVASVAPLTVATAAPGSAAPGRAAAAAPLPGLRGIDLGEGVELRGFADGPVAAGADELAFVVERVAVDPGDTIQAVDGPQVIDVEAGLVAFEDDLGLEAELPAGSAQFFPAGQEPALTNTGEEPATIVRSLLRGGTTSDDADSGDAGNDDAGGDAGNDDAGGDTTGGGGDGPDPDDETSPRPSGNRPVTLAARQATDEAVLTIEEDACTPAELEILRGGSLIVENASGEDRAFTVDRLGIAVELADGDIEEIVIDGAAGSYTFGCSVRDEPVESLSGTLVVVADDAAAVTPEADSPPATTTTATIDLPAGEPGVLLDKPVAGDVPAGAHFFAARLILAPGGVLTLDGSAGAVAAVAEGGSLIVQRPDRAAGRLRDGRGVVLPAGSQAAIANQGETPVVLLLSGLALPATAEVVDDGDQDDSGDSGDTDPGGAGDSVDPTTYLPNDEMIADFGLESTGSAVESDDPADASFFFTDEDAATEALPGYGWLANAQQQYAPTTDEGDYGIVDGVLVLVDAFDSEQGASDYMAFIAESFWQGDTRTSRVVAGIDGVDEHFFQAFFIAEDEVDIGLLTIRHGSMVITIFVSGPDLDAKAMMEDLALAIFGPKG